MNSIESIELVHSGIDYFSRLHRIITNAQSEIHLQTYIFKNDLTGVKIANALIEAVSRNVKVFVLLDGYGSASLTSNFIKSLIKNGIHLRFFSPFFSANNIYLGRRLHHKVIVADGKIALIGGINIADKYQGTKSAEPWLDYAVQVTGKIAIPLHNLCNNIYLKKRRLRSKNLKSVFYSDSGASIRILQNDWLFGKNEISNGYLKYVRNAKKEVIIVGGYFFPGRRLIRVLKIAAQKGIRIKIILSGVSDIPLLRRAACSLYSTLLRNNIELYEWNKSVLHGKAAAVDCEWTTIGSFNLNALSSHGSIELNVEIRSVEFSELFTSHLNLIISQCGKITLETIKARDGISTKFMNWIAYWIVRIALVIVTYMPYKRFLKSYQNE